MACTPRGTCASAIPTSFAQSRSALLVTTTIGPAASKSCIPSKLSGSFSMIKMIVSADEQDGRSSAGKVLPIIEDGFKIKTHHGLKYFTCSSINVGSLDLYTFYGSPIYSSGSCAVSAYDAPVSSDVERVRLSFRICDDITSRQSLGGSSIACVFFYILYVQYYGQVKSEKKNQSFALSLSTFLGKKYGPWVAIAERQGGQQKAGGMASQTQSNQESRNVTTQRIYSIITCKPPTLVTFTSSTSTP